MPCIIAVSLLHNPELWLMLMDIGISENVPTLNNRSRAFEMLVADTAGLVVLRIRWML